MSNTQLDKPKENVIKLTRPNLFHLPEVSGVLIPEKKIKDKSITGSWNLYVNYKNAGRGVLDFSDGHNNIPLQDGSSLWFDPIPPDPSISSISRWSEEGRVEWQEGYTPDVAKLYDDLIGLFEYFLDFPSNESETSLAILALWTMLTYAFPAWDAVPYLFFNGTLGSGKSTVFGVLMEVIWQGILSSSMTAPCIFRALGVHGGVLLFDETDRLRDRTQEASEIRALLCSGYKKRGGRAHRLEKKGDDFVLTGFDVYSPKALAGIAQIPPTLTSRSIRFNMIRASKDSDAIRHRILAKQNDFQRVRDDLHAFALSYGQRFIELAQDFSHCGGMLGRDIELWQPLMAMATLVEENFGQKGLIGLLKIKVEANNADGNTVPEPDIAILKYVLRMAREKTPVTSGQILDAVGGVWPDRNRMFDKWSPKGVTSRLGQYGITSTPGRANKKLFLVDTEQLAGIEEKYGINLDESDD